MSSNNPKKRSYKRPEVVQGSNAMAEAQDQKESRAQKMGHINQDVAKASSLVVQNPMNALATTYKEAMAQAREHVGFGLQALTAATAMKDLSPAEIIDLHDYTKSVEDAVEETGKFARARALILKDQLGVPVGAAGLSREVKVGNTVKRFTINKHGLADKTVEAAIRAKDKQVSKYMEQVITYKLKENGQTEKLLIDDGVFTADELKAMEQEPTYRVERSKEVADE